MAYVISTPQIGFQPIAVTSTVQNHPLGTVVTAFDPDYGSGEFIYLLGVASTAVGLMVTYFPSTYQTALSPDTAALTTPYAWAMSANVASQYGWYQISGIVVAKKTGVKVSPGVAVYQSATTGRVMSTVATTKQVQNVRSANAATIASATSTVLLSVNRAAGMGIIL